MMILYNGQEAKVTGWFVDPHGHQLFMQRGQLAPICPHVGPVQAMWRLVREIAERTDR